MRVLNYSSQTYQPLSQNPVHQFAANHALRLYTSNTIYSFIPRNACSTLRLSLAIANGCIESPQDFNWIHQNNSTFIADLPSLATASYTFTILRCPYARLASTYLDKIVNRDREAWHFLDLLKRETNIQDLTFEKFINALIHLQVRKGKIHWRPQIDFLVYQQYGDYFCLEQFPTAITTLKEKINLDIVDARPLTRHGIDGLTIIHEGDFSNTPPYEIRTLKASGKCPAPKQLYTKALIDIVSQHYKDDIDLYTTLFGTENLMFS